MRGALLEDAARLALQPALHRVADCASRGVARQADEQARRGRAGVAAPSAACDPVGGGMPARFAGPSRPPSDDLSGRPR